MSSCSDNSLIIPIYLRFIIRSGSSAVSTTTDPPETCCFKKSIGYFLAIAIQTDMYNIKVDLPTPPAEYSAETTPYGSMFFIIIGTSGGSSTNLERDQSILSIKFASSFFSAKERRYAPVTGLPAQFPNPDQKRSGSPSLYLVP